MGPCLKEGCDTQAWIFEYVTVIRGFGDGDWPSHSSTKGAYLCFISFYWLSKQGFYVIYLIY